MTPPDVPPDVPPDPPSDGPPDRPRDGAPDGWTRRRRYAGKNPRGFHEKYKELNPERYASRRGEGAGVRQDAGGHAPRDHGGRGPALRSRPRPAKWPSTARSAFGGHARAMLERLQPGGRLIGLDVDPIELPRTEARLRAAGFGADAFVVAPQQLRRPAAGARRRGRRRRGRDPRRPRRVVDAARQPGSRLHLQGVRAARHADESVARRARVAAAGALSEEKLARAADGERRRAARRASSPAC